MLLFWIVGGALAVLGILAIVISQMPDSPMRKKRKEKRLPPPEPPKDWQGIAERSEKRAHNIESKLQEYERTLRDKDKEISEKQSVITGLERQFQQEQSWRKKEEEAADKEKKREKLLESELAKARDGLNHESTQRIKQEYELKELRLLKETQGADVRHLTGRNMELDRQVKSLTEENRRIKAENAVLNQKKEADQWIAKDEYTRVDKMLKRARWEVDQFKHKFPKEMWPKSILPRMEPVKPLAAQAAAPAEPAVPEAEAPAPAPALSETASSDGVAQPPIHPPADELLPTASVAKPSGEQPADQKAPSDPAVSGNVASPLPVGTAPETDSRPPGDQGASGMASGNEQPATPSTTEAGKEKAPPDTNQQV